MCKYNTKQTHIQIYPYHVEMQQKKTVYTLFILYPNQMQQKQNPQNLSDPVLYKPITPRKSSLFDDKYFFLKVFGGILEPV